MDLPFEFLPCNKVRSEFSLVIGIFSGVWVFLAGSSWVVGDLAGLGGWDFHQHTVVELCLH